jgi:hypothetical protein
LNNFTYYNPTKIYFGRNTIKNIGREMREQGVKKALLVCGRQSIFSNGVYDQVSSSLIGWYVDFIRFSGIQPNPLLSKVEEGVRLARQEGVDAILAVGGGSVFDSAKAIAAGVAHDGPVWDFFTGQARIKSALPIFGVLTLSATGSEMNGNTDVLSSGYNIPSHFSANKDISTGCVQVSIYFAIYSDIISGHQQGTFNYLPGRHILHCGLQAANRQQNKEQDQSYEFPSKSTHPIIPPCIPRSEVDLSII